MAGEDRRSSPDLKDDLFNNVDSFSYYQVIRLLRKLVGAKTDQDNGSFFNEWLRVRPPLSLGFPGADLAKLEEVKTKDDQLLYYRLTSSLLGLYGVSSPLPSHYTEELFEEASNDKTVTRDFYDAINQPLYRLLFQCWSKYRISYRVAEEQDEGCLEKLFCLQGLGLSTTRKQLDNPHQLLRYMGLFSIASRSALGLKTLLSDSLQLPDLELTPCVPRKVTIPSNLRNSLGKQGVLLGIDSYLGGETDDRMGKVRVTLSSLDSDRFHRLLPPVSNEEPESNAHSLYNRTAELIKVYLTQPIDYDLELILKPETVRTVMLGQSPWSRLGLDSWVFSGSRFPGNPQVTVQCGRS